MTVFDLVTVGCFAALVVVFFTTTDRSPKLLLRFLIAGFALAVANQVGNQGYAVIAASLIAASAVFLLMYAAG